MHQVSQKPARHEGPGGDETDQLSLRRFIQRSLPGKTLKGEGSEGARIGISSAATAAT